MQLMTETCELLLRGESTEYDEYGVPAVSYTHLTLPTNREV